MTETTITAELLPPLENGHIAAFNATEAGLATLRAELEGKTFDCSDRAQDAEARSARRELVTVRTTIEQRRKELKAPLLDRGRVVDEEAKRITGEVLKLEQPIDAQIKAEEKRKADEKAERDRAENERAARVVAAIDGLRNWPLKLASADSRAIESALQDLATGEPLAGLDATEAEAAQCAAVAEQVTVALHTLTDAARTREEEAASLQREREALDRQRKDEEARAAAERGKQMAEAAAERDRLAAERAQQAEADRLAREAEQAKLDEQRRADEARIAEERRIEQERIDQVNAAERQRMNDEAAALRQQQEATARDEAEKRAAEREAQRQRWASRKVLKGAVMTDAELSALVTLLYASSIPGPSDLLDIQAHAALADWTDNEARRHGFTGWRDALAGFAAAKEAPVEAAA